MLKSKIAYSEGKSPLLWVGAKSWQVDTVRPLWEHHRIACENEPRWVEPFCGGASMAFGLRPRFAILNDANTDLMRFYARIRCGAVWGDDEHVQFENHPSAYALIRARYNAAHEPPVNGIYPATDDQIADMFYYLNQAGYGGLYRVNKSGHFNVPYGNRSWGKLEGDFRPFRPIMSEWTLLNLSYNDVWWHVNPTDFIYADPPYDSDFTSYTSTGFTWDDQVALANRLAWHSGPVIATNQDTARIRTLYGDLGFTIVPQERTRRIRSATGKGGAHQEVMMVRNLSLPQGLFYF